jgi:hypothetical protein
VQEGEARRSEVGVGVGGQTAKPPVAHASAVDVPSPLVIQTTTKRARAFAVK